MESNLLSIISTALFRPHQYLDPGSGSFLIQLLIGGLVAVGVVLRGEAPVGREGRRPAGEGDAEAPALLDRLGGADGEELGNAVGERHGRGEDRDLRLRHRARHYGLLQRRPSRARSSIAASGPHVPDS